MYAVQNRGRIVATTILKYIPYACQGQSQLQRKHPRESTGGRPFRQMGMRHQTTGHLAVAVVRLVVAAVVGNEERLEVVVADVGDVERLEAVVELVSGLLVVLAGSVEVVVGAVVVDGG